jgi:hypothetical protein
MKCEAVVVTFEGSGSSEGASFTCPITVDL